MTESKSNKKQFEKGSAEKTLEFFCRHLVALCVTYRRVKNGILSGETIFSAYPGIVICIRGFCNFLTAGHSLKDLNNHLESGDIIVESAVLADTFGPGAISGKPIPFDLVNEPKFFIYDKNEGLDFGIIALKPYYVSLLVKHGIIALFEENWINQGNVQFDSYTMLGLPEESITYEQNIEENDSPIIGKVCPTMIGVKAIENPETAKPTTYTRFIGQLHKNLPLSSIVGMSGGPIFGFRYGPPMAYWIVAIQSSWLRSKGIVFGCPLVVLAGLLTTWIDELAKSEEYRSLSE